MGRDPGGKLLFSVGSADGSMMKRIREAVEESRQTCENCGDPAANGLCMGCATLILTWSPHLF
jgi:hypothetical protein